MEQHRYFAEVIVPAAYKLTAIEEQIAMKDSYEKQWDRIFDGSDPDLIEAERKLFEADAGLYGFDLTRHLGASPEPWGEYANETTGHRWGGWLAARTRRPK